MNSKQSVFQSGFRNNHSSETAELLLMVSDDLTIALSQRSFIFFFFKFVYTSVLHHNILLKI